MNILSKKMFVVFAILPFLPFFPVVGYMQYMIEYDSEVVEFKKECESNRGIFTFDIPKIMYCKESPYIEYLGKVILTLPNENDSLDDTMESGYD